MDAVFGRSVAVLFLPRSDLRPSLLAAALMLASPCGETRLPLIGTTFWPFCFAHLALCAAAIRLRAAADMRPVRVLEELPPDVSALMAASRRSRSCWSCLTITSRFAMAGLSHLPHLSQNLLTATSPPPPWLAWMGKSGRRLLVQALMLLGKNPVLALLSGG
jgi:hypothetical protein